MLGLPQSTEFNKIIPKEKFYKKMTISPLLKRQFVELVHRIYWRNKLASSTLNIAAGVSVQELEIFEIQLKGSELPEDILRQLDQDIPYHLLFVLSYADKEQARIAYKEATAGGSKAFKVGRYYATAWLPKGQLRLQLNGLHMDALYESFVRQIARAELKNKGQNLQESVELAEQRAKLEKQMAALQAKIRREKQFNRQVELNRQLKELRKQWEEN